MPQLLIILRHQSESDYAREMNEVIYWSADVFNYILPPLLGERLAPLNRLFFNTLEGRGEFAIFPGVGIYILLILIIRRPGEAAGKFWLGVAALALLLSLGPVLKVIFSFRSTRRAGPTSVRSVNSRSARDEAGRELFEEP